jgi:polysaccharide export outer membrane protein
MRNKVIEQSSGVGTAIWLLICGLAVQLAWPGVSRADEPTHAVDATAREANSAPSPQSAMSSSLGVGDDLSVTAPGIEQLDHRDFHVDSEGAISVPLIGRVKAAGLTTQQLSQEIAVRMRKYYRNPEVSVRITQLRSKSVSILGAVNQPGIQQADGNRTLSDMLALVGGVRSDAGPFVEVTRWVQTDGAKASDSPDGNSDSKLATSMRFRLAEVLSAKDPGSNITVRAGDVINVPKARYTYVVGDVRNAGAFPIQDGNSLTLVKVIALAGGVLPNADSKHIRLIHSDDGRSERIINLKDVLTGKTDDVGVQREDIVFVPGSIGKNATLRAIEAAIQVGTGLAIFRP